MKRSKNSKEVKNVIINSNTNNKFLLVIDLMVRKHCIEFANKLSRIAKSARNSVAIRQREMNTKGNKRANNVETIVLDS